MALKDESLETRVTKVEDEVEVLKGLVKQILLELHSFRQEVFAQFEKIDKRFEKIDDRFEKIDERFEKIDARFERLDDRFEKINARFDFVHNRMDTWLKWVFVFMFTSWFTLMISIWIKVK